MAWGKKPTEPGGRTPKGTIKKQLQGKDCKHPEIKTDTNSKGKLFKECVRCGAFLGMV